MVFWTFNYPFHFQLIVNSRHNREDDKKNKVKKLATELGLGKMDTTLTKDRDIREGERKEQGI